MRRLRFKFVAFFVSCLMVAMTQAVKTQPNITNADTAQTGIGVQNSHEVTADEAGIIDLTNKERKKKGLKPLTANTHLTMVAREQSASMARHHHLSHTVNGKDFSYRIKKSGYPFRHVGENVARSKRDLPHVIQMWMKSNAHRGNILNPHFKEIGIGITLAKSGDKYYTQVFGTQK